MTRILKIYIGEKSYISIKAVLKKVGMEKVKDYYKNENQEKIIENMKDIFSEKDFEEFKKLVTQSATIDFLGSAEKFEGTKELSDLLKENCKINIDTVLYDYKNLESQEFNNLYRSGCLLLYDRYRTYIR